jgi:RNA polymerase sigma factor (sigma-70 family)
MNAETASDARLNELRKCACGGDAAAEERLFQHLTARFQLFAQRKIGNVDEVNEIVQDALMTVLGKYRTMEFETSFAGWAHGVLHKKILGYYRAKTSRDRKVAPLDDRQDSPASYDLDPILESRLLECLKKVAAANRRHARILNLHYLGYSVDEICRKLGLTRANFYSVLSRARSMLADCLEKGDTKS